MIRGFFDSVSYERPLPRFEVAVFLPHISPHWVAVNFLVDTGATSSLLQATEMRRGFRIDSARLSSPERWSRRHTVSGIDGDVTHYVEPARLVFIREDGTARIIDQDISIAPRLAPSRELPSLLGWDVLRHFRLCLDLVAGDVTLEER